MNKDSILLFDFPECTNLFPLINPFTARLSYSRCFPVPAVPMHMYTLHMGVPISHIPFIAIHKIKFLYSFTDPIARKCHDKITPLLALLFLNPVIYVFVGLNKLCQKVVCPDFSCHLVLCIDSTFLYSLCWFCLCLDSLHWFYLFLGIMHWVFLSLGLVLAEVPFDSWPAKSSAYHLDSSFGCFVSALFFLRQICFSKCDM